MKIAIVANSSWNIVNYRTNIIRTLQVDGNNITVIAPRDKYTKYIEQLNVTYIPVEMSGKGLNPYREAITLVTLYKEYRKHNFDLVFHYTIKPALYGGIAARVLGTPYISTITGLGSSFIADNWLTRVVCILYKVSQIGAIKVFFQNNDDKLLFINKKLVPESRSEVVPGSGVNLDKFRVTELPNRSGNGNKNPMIFLMVSRLLWDKGVLEYIEASRLVRQRYPNVKFQFLGEVETDKRTGVPPNSLDAWIKTGDLEYLGTTFDVRPFIENSDCVVLPSYREGLPRVLLEAGAMGRPVIATNVPGCRDVVDDGVTGFLCTPKDSNELSNSILKYIELPYLKRMRLATASRKRVERMYDERIVAKMYTDSVKSIIKGCS